VVRVRLAAFAKPAAVVLLATAPKKINDALRTVRFGPVEAEIRAIRRRDGTVVRRHDEMFGRIVDVRQIVERHPAGPFGVAGPAVRGTRTVARRAHRNVTGRVVPDVPVDVRVDEVLRRYDVALQRAGELRPVARRVHLQKRFEGAIVRIERRPAERERLERRRLRLRLRFRVVRIDGVGHERAVPRHAHAQLNRRRALDDDRFRNHRDRFLRAAEFGEVSGGIEALAIEVLDVRRDVGRAPRDELITSERDSRNAGERAAGDFKAVGSRHVREVPRRRQPCAEMRIVGEQRLAARGQRAVHDPVVGAEAVGGRAGQELTRRRVARFERRRERARPERNNHGGHRGHGGRNDSVFRIPVSSVPSVVPLFPRMLSPFTG